jgi:hypothetical protein
MTFPAVTNRQNHNRAAEKQAMDTKYQNRHWIPASAGMTKFGAHKKTRLAAGFRFISIGAAIYARATA